MINTKLINVLRTFSKSEMKEFEKFISSPFFNKGRNYIPFLNELKKFYPKFDNEKMTRELIFSRIYPGKKYNKQIIWNMNSALLNMAEEYLIFHSLKENSFVRNQSLAEEYYYRKLSNYFLKVVNEMENKIDREGIDDNYFIFKTQIERLRKAYNFLEDTQHLIPKHVVKKGEYTILNFLTAISGVISDMEINLQMFNARFDFNLSYNFIQNLNLEEIVKYAKTKNYRYAWFMEMCYFSILIITEKDSLVYYTELKRLLMENFNKLTLSDKNVWLTVLANYCSGKSGEDEIYFGRELFEINKISIKEDLLMEGRYFFKIKFTQILRNAILINENQWARNFIEKFVPKLKPSYQKSMRALGNAFLNFNLGNYEAVLENLKNVRFIDNRDKLHVKNLYLRTYYELDEIETVILLIDSTKHFISNNAAITETSKTSFIKSLNYLGRLINARMNRDKDEIGLILNALQNEKGLTLGKWLVEKAEDLRAIKY